MKQFKEQCCITKLKTILSAAKNKLAFLRKKTQLSDFVNLHTQLLHKKIKFRFFRREYYKFLPEKGLEVEDIVAEATEYKTMGDPLFERGRVSGGVYADEGVEEYNELMLKIFALYSHANANFVDIFPGVRKMEAEIVRMLCSLYHGPAKACGTVTTSATESIILACNAYRNIAVKRGIRKPEIIIGQFLKKALM